DAEVAEVDAEGNRGKALQDEQHAAGGEQLVNGRRGQQRRDDDEVQCRAECRDQQDGDRRRGPVREAENLDQIIHAVHADHDQLGITDPGHVDDAEDQVEPECQQRQHATEQDAVDHRLQQINVEDVQKCLHPYYTPRYACWMVSLLIMSVELPDARMLPASSRYARSTTRSTCCTFCSAMRTVNTDAL